MLVSNVTYFASGLAVEVLTGWACSRRCWMSLIAVKLNCLVTVLYLPISGVDRDCADYLWQLLRYWLMMLPIHISYHLFLITLLCFYWSDALSLYRGIVSGPRQAPWNNRDCAIAGDTVSCESSLYEQDLRRIDLSPLLFQPSLKKKKKKSRDDDRNSYLQPAYA